MLKTDVISCHWPARKALSPHVIELCHCVLPQRMDARGSTYSCWVLDYEYESSTYCRLDGSAEWQLRPARTAHLYPPGTVYWEKPRPEVKLTHSAWFLFTGRLEEEFRRFVRVQGYAMFDDPEGLMGQQLRAAAHATRQRGRAAYWSVHAALATCLGYLADAKHVQSQRWTLSPASIHDKEQPDLVAAVDDYLRARLAERITLDDLAEHVGVSSSTLSHQYRRLTGETPMARQLRRRVEAAKILVRRGYPLRHIAGHVGFCDEYHFAKTFKRLTGKTPKQFRRAEPPRE